MAKRGTRSGDGWATLVDNIKDYLAHSTIHGSAYVGAAGRNLAERVVWFMIVMAAFIIGGVLVHGSVTHWLENPILTSIDTFDYPVNKIQFPTVTVCSQNDYDPWDFLRPVLNQYKFACNGDNDCKATEAIRADFAPVLDSIKTRFLAALDAKIAAGHLMVIKEKAIVAEFARAIAANAGMIDMGKLNQLLGDMVVGIDRTREVKAMLDRHDQQTAVDLWNCLEKNTRNRGCLSSAKTFGEAMDCAGGKCDGEITANDVQNLEECLANSVMGTSSCIMDKVLEAKCGNNDCTFVNSSKAVDMLAQKVALVVKMPKDVQFGDLMADFYPVLFEEGKGGVSNLEVDEELKQDVNDRLNKLFRDISGAPPSTKFDTMARLFSEGKYFSGASMSNMEDILRSSALPHVARNLDFESAVSRSPEAESARLRLAMASRTPYALMPNGTVAVARPKMACVFEATGEPCQFVPTVTDSGICWSYNALPLNETYRPSTQLSALNAMYNLTGEANGGQGRIMNKGSGTSFAMSILIDTKETIRGLEWKKSFPVLLSTSRDYFSVMGGTTFDAKVGYKITVKLTAVENAATDAFKQLNIEDRKCLTPPEAKSDTLFQYHTQEACLFDCHFRAAVRAVGCRPWYYPADNDTSDTVNLCDGQKAAKFKKEMILGGYSEECDCLPDCEKVEFNYRMLRSHLDDYCTEGLHEVPGLDPNVIISGERSRLWLFRRLSKKDLDVTVDHVLGPDSAARDPDTKVCVDIMELDYAAVRIEVEKPRLQRNIKQLRVTWSDQLGTIGGMIGLFTGLSLVSFVEIIYWVFRAAFSCRFTQEDDYDSYGQDNDMPNSLRVVRQTKVAQAPRVSDIFE